MPKWSSASAPCDQSGLCDEIDRIAESDRVLLVNEVAAMIVDVSPIALGHCLLVTRRHVTRSGKLNRDEYNAFAKTAKHAGQVIGAIGEGPVLLVEHGARESGGVWDCVRHAHLHIVPVTSASMCAVGDFISDYMDVGIAREDSALEDIYTELQSLPEYLLVSFGSTVLVGHPRPELKHGSRDLIARTVGASSDLIDWAVAPRSRLFSETVETIALSPAYHV